MKRVRARVSFDTSSVGSKKGWRKHRMNVSRDGLCSFTLTRHHKAEAEDTCDLAHDSERQTKNNGSGGKRKRGGGGGLLSQHARVDVF